MHFTVLTTVYHAPAPGTSVCLRISATYFVVGAGVWHFSMLLRCAPGFGPVGLPPTPILESL